MTADRVPGHESVLSHVRAWPAAGRLALVQEVLETITPLSNGDTPMPTAARTPAATSDEDEDWWAPKSEDDKRTAALKRLRGLLASDKPPPYR